MSDFYRITRSYNTEDSTDVSYRTSNILWTKGFHTWRGINQLYDH
jgi:hypothetical protein